MSRLGIVDTLSSSNTGFARGKGYPFEGKNDAPNPEQSSLANNKLVDENAKEHEIRFILLDNVRSTDIAVCHSLTNDLELSECLLSLTERFDLLSYRSSRVQKV